MSMLLHGCMHDTPNTTKEYNNGVREEVLATDTAAGEDTLSQLPEGLADVRRPDMKVRIRKGSALLLETEGFQLSAVDTAVRHAGVYSVTSLLEEDLEPLPQGMKNMTASAAGYRLLPGGEHFSPYAEVRVAYDPACPKAIRPTISTLPTTTAPRRAGCVWNASKLTPSTARLSPPPPTSPTSSTNCSSLPRCPRRRLLCRQH